ncbi:hypothetical protein [Sutcliffiella horikoshii]|uniref:hypothetical protein n=1 Tax=Sutcliffiella horikoshii TaxID=79883 RepID=UPI001F42C5F3|nr:hypothetical protein [Sutcliffiella horikoshii]MCG1022586.1 hypothetical protein [Sutcliffiella horikoshii]
MKKSDELFELYKQLWNSRSLQSLNMGEGNMLHQAIRTELNDELTHPRTRKKPEDKYVMAIKRILASQLEDSDQLLLIKEFTVVLDGIKKGS